MAAVYYIPLPADMNIESNSVCLYCHNEVYHKSFIGPVATLMVQCKRNDVIVPVKVHYHINWVRACCDYVGCVNHLPLITYVGDTVIDNPLSIHIDGEDIIS
jgi:hypothetical protein